jgi:hypothetical protein
MRRLILTVAGLAAFAGTAHSEDVGAWTVINKTAALDGAQSYQAVALSSEKLTNIIDQPEQASLFVSCDAHGFAVAVNWPDFLVLQDQRVNIAWKLDDGSIKRESWRGVSQGALLRGPDALAALKGWAAGKKLVVRLPDKHGGQDATFDVDGIAAIYTAVSNRNCG